MYHFISALFLKCRFLTQEIPGGTEVLYFNKGQLQNTLNCEDIGEHF